MSKIKIQHHCTPDQARQLYDAVKAAGLNELRRIRADLYGIEHDVNLILEKFPENKNLGQALDYINSATIFLRQGIDQIEGEEKP